jgi:restriction system protein
MGRKQKGLLDEVFETALMLPWWGGLLMAGALWFAGDVLTGRSPSPSLAPLLRLIFNGAAVIAVAGAFVSAIKRNDRRRLLDQQRDIESIRSLSWQQFEWMVGEAYRRQGYAIEETGGGGADGGVDILLQRRRETVLVQCKRWKTKRVGVDKVRELYGVVTAEKANRGILVCCGHFTRDALAFAKGKPLTLVDGPALAALVASVQTRPSQKCAPTPIALAVNSPLCPKCGSDMILRTARRGQNVGNQFYGCSTFPNCRGIVSAT